MIYRSPGGSKKQNGEMQPDGADFHVPIRQPTKQVEKREFRFQIDSDNTLVLTVYDIPGFGNDLENDGKMYERKQLKLKTKRKKNRYRKEKKEGKKERTK